jgi:DNA-binding IclR family transcriptional regulator
MTHPEAEPDSTVPGTGIRSLDRAVAILKAFTPERRRIGVLELARLTDLSPSTTHRIVSSLTQHGLLHQITAGGDYALGAATLRIAMAADATMDLAWLAQETLIGLRDDSGETSAIHVFEPPAARVTLAQQEGLHPLRRSYTDMGQPIPLYQGASSQALLAYLPQTVIDTVLAGPFTAATTHTMTDPAVIAAELERIRNRGYALSVEGRVSGTSSVAAPVFDHAGHIAAALSISGPSGRMSESRWSDLAAITCSHAHRLSTRLGYQGPSWGPDAP